MVAEQDGAGILLQIIWLPFYKNVNLQRIKKQIKMKTKKNAVGKKRYGTELKKNIEKMGLKKFKIANLLNIQRPTFNRRLEDGQFNVVQLGKLRKQGWLKPEVEK